jgi:hypothetical protein
MRRVYIRQVDVIARATGGVNIARDWRSPAA